MPFMPDSVNKLLKSLRNPHDINFMNYCEMMHVRPILSGPDVCVSINKKFNDKFEYDFSRTSQPWYKWKPCVLFYSAQMEIKVILSFVVSLDYPEKEY